MLVVFVCWGCAAPSSEHPDTPANRRGFLERRLRELPTVGAVEPWQLPKEIKDGRQDGLQISTRHYVIFTTLTDPLILQQVPVFLESAFSSYCQVLGRKVDVNKQLVVYLFGNRGQWENFSRVWAGDLAPAYMQIRAGAYYLNGACVAYHLGRQANFSVLAHEGWHQFSDELFQYRLPAWLDEGLATNFETYQWQNGKIRFVPRRNGSRLAALKLTLGRGTEIPLADLLAWDAGRVLSHSTGLNGSVEPQLAAYYAQVYALIRFLRESNYGKRSSMLRRLLEDARLGRWPLDEPLRVEALQRAHNPSRRWNATVGTQIFQTYIAGDLSEIEGSYRTFCRKVVTGLKPR